MSDIVERIFNIYDGHRTSHIGCGEIAKEAALEIVRLREERDAAIREIGPAFAEVERLLSRQADYDGIRKGLDVMKAEAAKDAVLFAELRGQVTEQAEAIEHLQEQITEIPTLCRRYEAEIERLREERDGLRMPDELVEKASAALNSTFTYDSKMVLRDILAWHESLKEQKDE